MRAPADAAVAAPPPPAAVVESGRLQQINRTDTQSGKSMAFRKSPSSNHISMAKRQRLYTGTNKERSARIRPALPPFLRVEKFSPKASCHCARFDSLSHS